MKEFEISKTGIKDKFDVSWARENTRIIST